MVASGNDCKIVPMTKKAMMDLEDAWNRLAVGNRLDEADAAADLEEDEADVPDVFLSKDHMELCRR